ncbi:MAG: hypothetical protein FXF47_10065 [Candidatus Mcinerneyibacterium aminivorans]|uniref:Uncharacterized protein n=1 Tax=Candidatus Mcinerneyibacterium aminivorans TaxID=2703815 RepID=A0A5D0MGA5_9BACT|nr:MAG: hypothetical protein FXF47_10065 [Candidatus Mcinerneyibacterium aminivorans]
MLNEIGGLKVIHLKRENVLRTILSRKVAGKTGKYSAYKNINKKNQTKGFICLQQNLKIELIKQRNGKMNLIISFLPKI